MILRSKCNAMRKAQLKKRKLLSQVTLLLFATFSSHFRHVNASSPPISCTFTLSGSTWPVTEPMDTFTTDDVLTVDWLCNDTSSTSDALTIAPQGQDCSCTLPGIEPTSASSCIAVGINEQVSGQHTFSAGDLESNTGNHTLTIYSRNGTQPSSTDDTNCAHLGTSEFVFNVVAKPKVIVAIDPCTPGSPCISENAADSVFPDTITYGLALNSEPTGDVWVTLSVSTSSIPFEHQEFSVSPSILIFPANTDFATAQDVTVMAIDDSWREDTADWVITHTCTSADPMYNGLTMTYSITAADDDRVGVLYERPSPDPNNSREIITLYEGVNNITREATCFGNSILGTFRLLSQPIGPVTLSLSTLVDNELIPRFSRLITDPAVLSFDGTTWNATQEVYIAASDDGEAFGDWTARLVTASSSTDPDYNIERVGNPSVTGSGVIRHGPSKALSIVGGNGWIPFSIVDDDRSGVRFAAALIAPTQWTGIGEGSPPLNYELSFLSQPVSPTFLVMVNNCTSWQEKSVKFSLSGNTTRVMIPLLEINGVTDYVHIMAVDDVLWDTPINIFVTPTDDENKYNTSDSVACALRHFLISDDPNYSDPYANVTQLVSLPKISNGVREIAQDSNQQRLDNTLRETVFNMFNFYTPTGYYMEFPRNFVRSITVDGELDGNSTTGVATNTTMPTSQPTKSPVELGIFTVSPTSAPTGYSDQCGRYPRSATTEAYVNLILLDNDSSVMGKQVAEYLSYVCGMLVCAIVLVTLRLGLMKFFTEEYNYAEELEVILKQPSTTEDQKNQAKGSIAEENQKEKQKMEEDEATKQKKLERYKVLDLSLYLIFLFDELQFMTLLSQTSAVSLHAVVYPYFAHGFWWANFEVGILGSHSRVVDIHQDGQDAINRELLFANCLFTFACVLCSAHVLRRTLRKTMFAKHRHRLNQVVPEPTDEDDEVLLKMSAIKHRQASQLIMQLQRRSTANSKSKQNTRVRVERIVGKDGKVELQTIKTSASLSSKSPFAEAVHATTNRRASKYLSKQRSEDKMTPTQRREVKLAKAISEDKHMRAWDRATTPWMWELPVMLIAFPGLIQTSSLVVVRHLLSTGGIVGALVLATFVPWFFLFCFRKIQHDVIPMRTVQYNAVALSLKESAKNEDIELSKTPNETTIAAITAQPRTSKNSIDAIVEFDEAESDDNDNNDGNEEKNVGKKRKRRGSHRSSSLSVTEIAHFIPGMVLNHSAENHDIFGYWRSKPEHENYTLRFGILFTSLNGAHAYTMLWWPMRLVKSIALAVVFAVFSYSTSEIVQQSQSVFLALTEASFMIWFILRPAYRSPTPNFLSAISFLGHACCFFGSAWLVDGSMLGISFNRDTVESILVTTSGVLLFQSLLLQMYAVFHVQLLWFFNKFIRNYMPCFKTEAQIAQEIEEIDRNMKSDDEVELDDLMKQAKALGFEIDHPLTIKAFWNLDGGLTRASSTGNVLSSANEDGELPPLRGVKSMGQQHVANRLREEHAEMKARRHRNSFLS